MITSSRDGGIRTYYGLSEDNKPVNDMADDSIIETNVANGSCFIEMDTGSIYFYSTSHNMWLLWGVENDLGGE